MNKLNIRNTYPLIVFIIGFIHLSMVFILMNFTFERQLPDSSPSQKNEIKLSLIQDPIEEVALPVEPVNINRVVKDPIELTEKVPVLKKQMVAPVVDSDQKRTIDKVVIKKHAPRTKSVEPIKVQEVMSKKSSNTKQVSRQALREKLIAKYIKLKRTYNQDLEQYLVKHKRFPALAKRFGHEGLVKYKIRVEKDGSFSKITKTLSSGFESLDSESLNLLKQASGLKPLPGSLPFLTLNIPIEYKLH